MTLRSLILGTAFTLISSAAIAAEVGRVTTVQVNYRTEIQYTPGPANCYQTQVPVYGNGANGGDIITGAIIGGAIGNQFGGGSGKDVATALGAILGADAASRGSNRIIGYQTVTQCNDTVQEHHTRVRDGYTVFYTVNGHSYSFHTYEQFTVGDRIIHR